MPRKTYLIVSRSFYPGNSPRANRTTELAKELCRQGHQLTVLTPHHPAQAELVREFGMIMIDLGQDRWPEIPIAYLGKSSFFLRALRRGLQQTVDYPWIELVWRIPAALSKISEHDVLISIAAPHAVHWAIARVARRGQLPARVWLADCGDPYMGRQNDSFPSFFYFKYPEKAFCRYADAITVPVEGARAAYYPEFRDKIHVIPQGFRFADYVHLKAIAPRADGVRRFAYAGLFIPGRRDPRLLLKLLTERNEPFEFHVFTKNPVLVTPFAERDSRIILRDFIARERLLEELAGMNFLVNIENVGARQTPSKLIDYWLCNRPILNLKSDHIQTGVLDQFFSGNYENALAIERPERYEIGNIVRQFDQLADETLQRKRGDGE